MISEKISILITGGTFDKEYDEIKGILSFFLGLFIIIIFFSILSALFSGEKEEVITVKNNSLLQIDNLSIIDDRDTKPSELNFDFGDIPLPFPLLDNSDLEQKMSLKTFERVISSAKEDDKIKGIYLNIENASISYNKIEKVSNDNCCRIPPSMAKTLTR